MSKVVTQQLASLEILLTYNKLQANKTKQMLKYKSTMVIYGSQAD